MKHHDTEPKKEEKRTAEPCENSFSAMKLNLINYVARSLFGAPFMQLGFIATLLHAFAQKAARARFTARLITNLQSPLGEVVGEPSPPPTWLHLNVSRASLQHVNHTENCGSQLSGASG